MFYGRPGKPALCEILKSRRARRAVERRVIESRRLTVHVEEPFALYRLTSAGFFFVLRQGDSGARGEELDRRAVVEVLALHLEGYDVPARSAAEAVEVFRRREHREGRRFFTMKRTQPVVVRARAL